MKYFMYGFLIAVTLGAVSLKADADCYDCEGDTSILSRVWDEPERVTVVMPPIERPADRAVYNSDRSRDIIRGIPEQTFSPWDVPLK